MFVLCVLLLFNLTSSLSLSCTHTNTSFFTFSLTSGSSCRWCSWCYFNNTPYNSHCAGYLSSLKVMFVFNLCHLHLSLISLHRRKGNNKEKAYISGESSGQKANKNDYPLLSQKFPISEPGNIKLGNAYTHTVHTVLYLLLLLFNQTVRADWALYGSITL